MGAMERLNNCLRREINLGKKGARVGQLLKAARQTALAMKDAGAPWEKKLEMQEKHVALLAKIAKVRNLKEPPPETQIYAAKEST